MTMRSSLQSSCWCPSFGLVLVNSLFLGVLCVIRICFHVNASLRYMDPRDDEKLTDDEFREAHPCNARSVKGRNPLGTSSASPWQWITCVFFRIARWVPCHLSLVFEQSFGLVL